MCDTCPAHIPGPAELAGGVLGALVGAALTPAGRKVLFRGAALPVFLSIIVYTLGWWLVPIAVALAGLAVGVLLAVRRVLHGRTVLARPEPTPEMRAMLAARGLKAVPAPGQARPALPRAMRRQLGRGRLSQPAVKVPAPRPAQALPAAQRALEGVVVTPPARTARPRP